MLNFGSEQTIEAAGRSYRLDKLRLRHSRALRDWIAERIGDPFALAERFVDRLPPAEALALVREGEEVKRQLESFTMLGDLSRRFLFTELGMAELARHLTARHHPGLDEDELQDVAESIALKLVEVLEKAMGSVPNAAGGVVAPPDESTGTGSTSASGTTGQGSAQPTSTS